MKKKILIFFGLHPVGYERPNLNNPSHYLEEKGIVIPEKKLKTHTHPVGQTLPFNEVFNPQNFK